MNARQVSAWWLLISASIATADGNGLIEPHAQNECLSGAEVRADCVGLLFPDLAIQSRPDHLVVGDFDLDGLPDLAGEWLSDSVRVWRSAQPGTLEQTSDVDFSGLFDPGSGGSMRDLVSGDLNGDGIADLVACFGPSPRVAVAEGDGGGGFGLPRALGYQGVVSAATLEDIDSDGDLDLVLAAGFRIVFGINDGSGVFSFGADPVLFSDKCLSVRFADFDGDGDRDAVALLSRNSQSDDFVTIERTSPGNFMIRDQWNAFRGGSTPVFADIDDDGDVDLINLSDRDGFVVARFNDGDGNFGSQTAFSYDPDGFSQDLLIEDFDSDGDLDLLFAELRDPRLIVGLNRGDGLGFEFRERPVDIPSVRVAGRIDFNADTITDVVLTGLLPAVSIFLGDGLGEFSLSEERETRDAGGEPVRVLGADFNSDGHRDLVTLNEKPSAVALSLSDGFGNLSEPLLLESGLVGKAVAAGDLDGDGLIDLVASDVSGGAVRVLLGRGEATFQSSFLHPLGTDLQAIQAEDIDGDGLIDLVGVSRSTALLSIARGIGGGGFAFPVNFPTVAVPSDFVITDINGDGLRDIFAASAGGRRIGVMLNDGTGAFSVSQLIGLQGGPADPHAFDIDSDGDTDVVVLDLRLGTPQLFENVDGSLLSPIELFEFGSRATAMDVGDINGDGNPDLALAEGTRSLVEVRVNDGTGAMLFDGEYRAGMDPGKVLIDDINADGSADLVVLSKEDASIAILPNLFRCSTSCGADIAEPFGVLNFFDISAFIGLFNAGDPAADVAAPFGSLSFFDVAEYIALFNAGCP